jgi:TolB-like protein/Flp pilus assembly protein TadD
MSPAEIRDQLSRILASPVFSESPRMVRFLRFAVEEALDGNAAELKENVIGTQVFDRAAGYDPRIDPIVRVEARRLRTKLRAYYDRYGQSDPVILDFPKGQYAPVFRMKQERERQEDLQAEGEGSAVAVLPFINLTPEPGMEFLSDGLTEELINALTRLPELRVVAWNSAAQLKGRQDEVEEIRERLHVAYVLRGSVRQAQERLRVSAHLIDTSKRQYIWSESYNRQLKDIFAIQEEIAKSIAVALRLKIGPAAASVIKGEKPRNMDAYQVCLKGRFHARERTMEGLQRSLVCFEQAIAIDPESSSAHAGLADTYTLLAEYGFADGPSSMEKAKRTVQRALALNPESAEAFASFGLILATYDWSWKEAGQAFERALQLNPGYAPAHHWYGIDCLAMQGRWEESRHHSEVAIKLDPLSAVLLECRAYLHVLTRNYDEAIRHASAIRDLDPSFYKAYTSMGRAYLQKGTYGTAIELFEKGLSLAGEVPSIFGALGQAYALSGNRLRANQILAKLDEMASLRPVPSTCFALIHLGLGETDTALTYLGKAVQRRESSVIGLKVHPAYDPLRGEPRCQALLEKLRFDA